MNSTLSAKRPAFRLAKRWTGAAVITIGALFAAHMVTAAPPAGTTIGNQASASYLDPNGNTQLATSNLVQTTVQQVGSFTFTADGAKSAAAGATVYVPHTLTNTGNGPDKFTFSVAGPIASSGFSRIEVFADADGDGLPDSTTTLCSTTTSGTPCAVPLQSVPGSNGTFKFVVAYSVPSTATGPSWTNNAGVVTAAVDGASTVPYSATSITNTDTVTLTSLAAFSVTKTIGQPAVAAGGVAWPSGQGVPVPTSGPRGTQTMYTLNYKNNGGASGTVYLTDTLPAGMTYHAESAVWSSVPGQSLSDTSGSEIDPRIEYEADVATGVIKVRIPNVGPNVSGTVSFVVDVKTTVAATMGVGSTTNTAKYSALTCAGTNIAGSTGCDSANTNSAVFTVTAVRRVVFGIPSLPKADDVTAGVPSTTGDNVTAASVVPGGSVRFSQTVVNTGDDTDTFKLSVSSNTFPSGTTFAWFASDLVSPLLDTAGGGVVDTGPLAAGASRTVVLQATIPNSTSVGTGPFNAVARATSYADATKIDAVQDVVTVVVGSLVDLTNNPTNVLAVPGDFGPGPGAAVVLATPVTNGAVAIIPLYVTNNDSASMTYNFSASQSPSFPGTMPAGYSVAYSTASTCTAPSVTLTLTVSTASQGNVWACVTVPSSAAAGSQAIYFHVASTTSGSTGAVVTDGIHDSLTISTAASLQYTVTTSNVGQAAAGGSVTYAHTFTNSGNQSCGAFSITATPSAAGVTAGWTTSIYLDNNNDGMIDSGDTLVTTGTVPVVLAGGTQKILVRVFAPGGAAAGTQEIVTVTTSDSAGGCVLSGGNPTDTTTIITGQVRVVKSQASDPTCVGTTTAFSGASFVVTPDHCIVYQIVATNEGTANVQHVTLSDAIPANTAYTAGVTQPATPCAATGLTGTAVAFGSTATTVSCGSAANTLIPGGTVTLKFAVRVAL